MRSEQFGRTLGHLPQWSHRGGSSWTSAVLTFLCRVHHSHLAKRAFSFAVISFDLHFKGSVRCQTAVVVNMSRGLYTWNSHLCPWWCVLLSEPQDVPEAVTVLVFSGHGLETKSTSSHTKSEPSCPSNTIMITVIPQYLQYWSWLTARLSVFLSNWISVSVLYCFLLVIGIPPFWVWPKSGRLTPRSH